MTVADYHTDQQALAMRRCFRWLLGLGTLALVSATPLVGQTRNVTACSKCHSDHQFLAAQRFDATRTAALLITDSLLRNTRHESLTCASCHPEHGSGYPHQASAPAAECRMCHAEPAAEWTGSVHASPDAGGDAATCVTCHSAHAVYAPDDRRSLTHPLNVAELCGSCHDNPEIIGTYFTAADRVQARDAVRQYYETVHGSALTRAGLTVSATCNDCHGAHDIRPADDSGSAVHRTNIAGTCGTCHVGILEVYAASAHGRAVEANLIGVSDHAPPVCVECHPAHGVVRANEPAWFIGVVEECGTCHERLYETYEDTYHGKVTRLGFGLTAKCSDCHTAHDMRAASDPASSVHPLNLINTCAQCHPAANQNFVKYYAHGDPKQRDRYPLLYWPWLFMTVLLVSVFSFFGVHTVLWVGRLTIDRLRAGVTRT